MGIGDAIGRVLDALGPRRPRESDRLARNVAEAARVFRNTARREGHAFPVEHYPETYQRVLALSDALDAYEQARDLENEEGE